MRYFNKLAFTTALWMGIISFVQAADITLEQAHAAVQAAMSKAKELKVKMDICIVDGGANLKYFVRMDKAWLGSIDIAIKKARTARFFDMNTGEIGKLSQPGGDLYNIEHSNGGLITFPGGVPIKNDKGETIGAIGVSGSTVEHDQTVAESGAKAATSVKSDSSGDKKSDSSQKKDKDKDKKKEEP